MTDASLATALPLIPLGLGAVWTMLLAPRTEAMTVRAAAAVTLLGAVAITLTRLGLAPVETELMRDDGLARFGEALVALTGLGALAYLRPPFPAKEAPALIILATLGAALLCGATHAATVFLGLELVTLSLIALFVLPRTRPALEAGYKLLILGGIGAGTLLMGLALAYAATGSLGLAAWSGRGAMVNLGAALLLAGIAFKFALVPFHMWTPDAFSGAPSAAAAFAGTGSKIGVAIVLMRLAAVSPPEPVWSLGLSLMAGASMVVGNLLALRQGSLRRMLGYSSIAHSGYLAAILAVGQAPEAVLFYLAAYVPALIAALCVAELLGDEDQVESLRGLIWRRPLQGAVLALSLLSLAGLPAAVGFFAKFYLFAALIRAEAWGLLAVAAVGSALGLYVYARFASFIFRQGEVSPAAPRWADSALLLVTGAALLGFGVYPGPLVEAIRFAMK